MNPILSIALLNVEAPDLSNASISLVFRVSSVNLLADATEGPGSVSSAILAVLSKVTSNNLILRSFDYYIQPILSEAKTYFTRVIEVDPTSTIELAFLNTETPLIYLLKAVDDSIASFSALSNIEVYKTITADVAETSEQQARVLLKRFNTEVASTLSYSALEPLLKKEDTAATLSELSRIVNYNRPEFSNTQPSKVAASETFNYIRPNIYKSILGFLENISVPKSGGISEDTLNLESLPSLSVFLGGLDSDLFISKAGRSHGGNWQGIGASLSFYKDNIADKILLEEDSVTGYAYIAEELTTLYDFDVKKKNYLSFTNPLAFAGFPDSLQRNYTWKLNNTRERQESRVDTRAERREKNWNSVGIKFDFSNDNNEEVEIVEEVLSAKAELKYSELKLQEDTERTEYLSFTNPLAFAGFPDSLQRNYTWKLNNTRERQESRVDTRAERREKNWNSVGIQFDFLTTYYSNAKTISQPLTAKSIFPVDRLDIEEATKRTEYLSFTNPLAFIGYQPNTLGRIYTWKLNNTRERQESRVDTRAERREKNWNSVGVQFDFLTTYYSNAKTISVDLSGPAKIRTELLESIDRDKKTFDISFVYPISFAGFVPSIYPQNVNRTYTWRLNNTRERQESRVDLRAERRELNWQGVGLKMSVPVRLPEQLIEIEEAVLAAKAHYASELVQIQHNQKKDIELNFLSPTGPERLEEQVNARLKNSLFLDKPLNLNLLTDSLFLLYRVPIFTQPIAVTQEVSDLEILLKKIEKIKIYSDNYLDITKDTSELINIISDAIVRRPVYSASISDVSDSLVSLLNSNYREAIDTQETFYRQAKYIRNPVDAVEVDATASGFAQDYSPAYFSQAYVGTAFLGE